MSNSLIIQDIVFIVLLILLAIPLGNYIYRIYHHDNVILSRWIKPIENGIFRLVRIDPNEEMNAKKYSFSIIGFSIVCLVFVIGLQMIQKGLFLNPQGIANVKWDLAFNTSASFVSNTNWQAYAGETGLSYLTQMIGLTVQNFASSAVGIAVLFVLCRGFVRKETKALGNFWQDLVRVILYILIPLSIILCILLMSQGVIQSFSSYGEIQTLEGVKQVLPFGPAASQIAIKQLGTNGGGFFGTNSAFPFENPTPISNFLEVISIILIPTALCFMFGKAVKDTKQGKAICIVMFIIFILALIGITCSEIYGAPSFHSVLASGSMEGKEVRFGVGGSSLWAAVTTAASNGSVNAMHDSLTPLAGMITLFLMQIGEVVFGGNGSGLYAMIGFAILTVFMAGLMVGRTPEYIGKKIGSREMKMVCIIILVPPICALLGSAIATFFPQSSMLQVDGGWLNNSGSHGFSEILYAYTSFAANNGSAFAGFGANNVFTNITGGMIMLIVRFIPMIAVIYLAQYLANKKIVPTGEGTLSTTSPLFLGFLITIIVIIGALTFLPALALGPIAEFFTHLSVLG